jgi:Delta14-sterol reductase
MNHSSGAARAHVTAAAMIVALPLLTYYLWICLTFYGGAIAAPRSAADLITIAGRIPAPTWRAVLLYGAWLALQAVLYMTAPGPIREGPPLADGSRLRYRLNGWWSFCATWIAVGLAVWAGGLPATVAHDEFGPLLTTANITAFALAGYLYMNRTTRRADAPGRSGITTYVMGADLNPRIRSFDLKFFCEGRPGLMLWVLINASLAAKQYDLHGTMTTPMLLVNAFQLLYVADFFFHEEAILSTWDIKHERFGWMLCWGCLVWVPFTFSIQAYYLVTHVHELSPAATIGLVTLNMGGYAIFRSVNLQKHRFRQDPSRAIWGREPQYIRTASGALLLTSGWWGLARHANYLGDLLMGLAWCLTTGFQHPLPYFYVVYFAILLVHRERRDAAMCLNKYGPDWEAYCRKVRWRIVPGLY